MRALAPVLTAALLAGCATTTSPTGRTQYVGAIPPAQLDQMGEQAFAEAKARNTVSTDAAHHAVAERNMIVS